MSKPIVIEVGGEPQGVVVPKGDAFRFVAVKFPAFAIDGQTFASVEDAQVAARQAVAPYRGQVARLQGVAA